MTRRKMETDLLRAKHPLFTEKLRGMIVRSNAENKGHPDIDSLAAAAVWSEGGLRFRNSFVKEYELDADQDGIPGQPAPQVLAALVGFINEALEYEAILSDLDDDAIVEQHRTTFRKIDYERRAERVRKGTRSDRFAFFNEARAEADWEKWLTKPVWTSEEATALSFGKEPSVVNTSSLNERKTLHGSPFQEIFFDRLDAVERAIKARMLSEAIKPSNFIAWCRKNRVDIPEEMQFKIGEVLESGNKGHNNRLHQCYKIILGLAVKNYEFEAGFRGKENSPSIGKMRFELESVGAKIDIKTLKSILQDAEDWAHESGARLVSEAKTLKAKTDAAAARGRPQPKSGISRP